MIFQKTNVVNIAMMQQIQILKPGSNKIPVVLQNLSCKVLKVKKGMKMAHVEASNIVPPLMVPQLDENMLEKVAGNAPKSGLLKSLPKGIGSRLEKLLKV